MLTLQFCVNYGGRAEIADAAKAIALDVAAGRLKPDKIDERTIGRYLDEPEIPDVDLFVRSSGEQRTSNFLLWQSAYAELVFLDTLFPDFDRRHLWHACEIYASRDRRYGGAVPNPVPPAEPAQLGRESAPARMASRIPRGGLQLAVAQANPALSRRRARSRRSPQLQRQHHRDREARPPREPTAAATTGLRQPARTAATPHEGDRRPGP